MLLLLFNLIIDVINSRFRYRVESKQDLNAKIGIYFMTQVLLESKQIMENHLTRLLPCELEGHPLILVAAQMFLIFKAMETELGLS